MAGDWSGDCTSCDFGLAGFRFPPDVIAVAVRWYLRYGPVLPRRGGTAGRARRHRGSRHHLPVGAAVHPRLHRPARPCRRAPGDRWVVGETYVKVAGQWTYLYRAAGQRGQVVDVLLSGRRDLAAARRFFTSALRAGTIPVEVTTDRAPRLPEGAR